MYLSAGVLHAVTVIQAADCLSFGSEQKQVRQQGADLSLLGEPKG